eukprot:5951378-Pleurochrysis_carterae.AAC.1
MHACTQLRQKEHACVRACSAADACGEQLRLHPEKRRAAIPAARRGRRARAGGGRSLQPPAVAVRRRRRKLGVKGKGQVGREGKGLSWV